MSRADQLFPWMKKFDAVKNMRDIRTRLSERYRVDARQQQKDLRRIREKYDIRPSRPYRKRSAVAEYEAE